jgi:CMP-N-acetylneuraminic acid synthetase
MTADIVVPAHASAKNLSTLGDVLLPMHAIKAAYELKSRGAVREVIVVTNIEELATAAEELEMRVWREPQELAQAPQIATVVAAAQRMAKDPSNYTLVLTPNVVARDVDKVAKFLDWAMDMGADASWTCEEVPCRPEMIVFDHHYEELVEQAIPGDERSHQRRLVLTTHYAIVARTAYLVEHEKLRPPHARLYQMPKGHVTWTINEVADLHWAERMLE